MTQRLARRLTFRLSIVIATAFALFLAAVPAQAVEHVAKPRYRGRSSCGNDLPWWLVVAIIAGIVLLAVVARNRSSAEIS